MPTAKTQRTQNYNLDNPDSLAKLLLADLGHGDRVIVDERIFRVQNVKTFGPGNWDGCMMRLQGQKKGLLYPLMAYVTPRVRLIAGGMAIA